MPLTATSSTQLGLGVEKLGPVDERQMADAIGAAHGLVTPAIANIAVDDFEAPARSSHLHAAPRELSSSTRTRRPSSTRRRASALPMNPVPPVTR